MMFRLPKDYHVPPRPVLTPVPSSPARTISASAYLVSSGLMLPAPPRPCEISGALIVVFRVRIGFLFF